MKKAELSLVSDFALEQLEKVTLPCYNICIIIVISFVVLIVDQWQNVIWKCGVTFHVGAHLAQNVV